MKIPHTQLNAGTLNALIEDFVTRDGTDYGLVEASMETRTAQVLEALEKGLAHIVFDEESMSCNIIPNH